MIGEERRGEEMGGWHRDRWVMKEVRG